MAVPSHDQVLSALSACNGDEEETVASLVTSSFLNNIYAGYLNNGGTSKPKSSWLNEELSTLLKNETLPRDVSCCTWTIVFYDSFYSTFKIKSF